MNRHLKLEQSPAPRSPAPSGQLGVIREMLSNLETLTAAGQQHVMGKVVAFMQSQVGGAARGAGPRNQQTLVELVGHLRRETDRMLPDVERFTHRAEHLVTLLAAVAA